MNGSKQSDFVQRTADERRFLGMQRCAKRLVLGLAFAGAASCVWAGTGSKSLSVTVTPLPSAVSYSNTSLNQQTYAAYNVTVKSLAKSGASNVWFKGRAITALLNAGDPPAGCTRDADLTAVTCELGAFAQGDSKSFVLVYDVPATPLSTGNIEFAYRIANGQGTANNQPSDSEFSQSDSVFTAVSVADTTGDSSSVQSYVLTTAGGTLSTQLADLKAKTTAKVPKNAPVFIEQKETSSTRGSCQNIYVLCFTSELRIQEGGAAIQFGNNPATALLVTLSRDTSTLKNANTSIDKAILRYSEDGRTFTDIQACNLDYSVNPQGTPVIPTGQVNCLVSREVDGSMWKFNLLATQNGFREF
jgi:hypothetical protein